MSEKDIQKKIAERLKEARQLSGLSQGQAAKMLEMHRPTISEIESGKRKVSATELAQFAELYEVSINYLMGEGADQMSPSDPKLQLAARELSKLSPDALHSLMRALAVIQSDDEGDDSNDGKA